MMKEYDAGKGAVQNNYDFDQQAKPWKEGTKAGESFNGRYSNYVNYNKAWQDTLDKIKPGLKAQDFPFEKFVDAKGKVHTDKLAAAMTRISVEGVSSTQIQNALKATMTPEIENQLRIDANYRFKDVDSEGLINHFTVNYDNAVKQIDKRIAAIQGYSKINGNDSGLAMKVDQSVKELTDQKIQLKNDLAYNLKLAQTNPEKAKTNIYKSATLSEFADAFSWEKRIEQLIDNPALQAQFERERINLQSRTLSETIRHNVASEKQAAEKFLWEKEVENRKYFGALSQFTDEFGDKTNQLKTPSEIVNDKIAGYNATISTNEAILKQQTGVDPEIAIKNYLNNPEKVKGEEATLINNIIEARKQKKIQENLKTTIEDAVKKKHPEFNIDNYLGEADMGWNGMNVKTNNGQTVYYTPKELMEFAKKYSTELDRATRQQISTTTGPNTNVKPVLDLSKMLPKERILANSMMKGVGNNAVTNRLNSYLSTYSKYKTNLERFDAEVNREMGNSMGQYLPQYTAVNTATPEANETYKNIVGIALSRYDFENMGVKGGTSQMSSDDAKALNEKIHSQDAGKLTYGFLNYGGEKSIVVDDGTKKYIVPISDKLAAQVPALQKQSRTVDVAQNIGTIQAANRNFSTNPTGNFEDSFLPKNKLPNVRSMNVGVDLKTTYTPSSTQYIDINLKLSNGEIIPKRVPGEFDASTAMDFLNQMNDKQIKELYLSDPTISNEVKQRIKNL